LLMVDIEVFYTVLKNIVASQVHTDHKCESLQSFAVLSDYTQIAKEQMTKLLADKDKPYFFSHKWAEEKYPTNQISYEYPILIAIPGRSNVQGLFNSDGDR